MPHQPSVRLTIHVPGWLKSRRRWAAVGALAAVAVVISSTGLVSAEAVPVAYSIWPAATVPDTAADSDTSSVELGVRFRASSEGWVTGIRFFKSAANTGVHMGTLWSSSGVALARVTFTSETASGWQEAQTATPVRLTPNVDYVASYRAPVGRYAGDTGALSPTKPTMTFALTATQGVYGYGSGVPTSTWQNSNYYVDVAFTTAPSGSPTTTTTAPSPPSTRAFPVVAGTPVRGTGKPRLPAPSTTTTTPQPPVPSSVKGCAARPSACGYPDASSAGVPAGKTLVSVPSQATSGPGWHYDSRGWVEIDGNGAVFDGYAVATNVDVSASNVTIRNTRILVGGESFGISLRHTANVTIESSQITAPDAGTNRLLVGIKDIYGDSTGLRVLRNDISRASTGVQVEAGLIQDNYIHDLGFTTGDHVNGTTSNGGTGQLNIVHNTIFNAIDQTDAISLFQDFGPQANRVIDNNLLAGGGYTIYAGANAGKESTATNIHVTNNRISRMYYPNGGSYGPLAAYNPAGGNTLTGNIWDETGTPVN